MCKWSPGQVPIRNKGITHPGVCEPLEDPLCMKENQQLGEFCNVVADINPCLEEIEQQRKYLIQSKNKTWCVSNNELSEVCKIYIWLFMLL